MEYKVIVSAGLCALVGAAFFCGCEKVETVNPLPPRQEAPDVIALEDVARVFAGLPVGPEQVGEVHDAAVSSAGNGYDEEYRMQDLFREPGAGVGDAAGTKAGRYARPLRDLLREALATKAGETGLSEAWLDSLAASDVQLYWPFSEAWDGRSLPVVTFDPGDFASSNVGYVCTPGGKPEKVMVDEQMARERPVWVVNRNSDAEYKSLELRRREDPSWGTGGGDVIVRPSPSCPAPTGHPSPSCPAPTGHPSPSAVPDAEMKTLILRTFKSNRQYDSWFAGASEFFVKIGSLEDFTAATDAELRLYQPTITDFMIVVRRGQVGEEIPFNAVLVSEWTGQLSSCAFMVVEDDGGTRTSWKCNAMVKISSKSYGFELEIPLYSRDDIVWRGSLTRNYIERYSGTVGHFGDVDMVLELI